MRYLLFFMMIAGPATAQQAARGTCQYQVDGVYEGQAMEPWSATTTVFDTANTVAIRHQVHRSSGTRFEYLFIPGVAATWINEGRGGSNTCHATLKDEVADFALYHVIAGMPTGEHELTMLVCADAGEVKRRIVRFSITPAEGGWSAKGSDDYPFELATNAERKVTRYIQPQGTVGLAIYTLR